jgi:hypothetical protein
MLIIIITMKLLAIATYGIHSARRFGMHIQPIIKARVVYCTNVVQSIVRSLVHF